MLKFLVKVCFDAYISKTIHGTCLIFGMDQVFFDAYISKTIQGTCLMFGMDLPQSIGFCYYTPGIYANGYIVFVFLFVRSYIRLFVRYSLSLS